MMPKRCLPIALLAAACLTLSGPAQALDMMVWDKPLETKLAYGESRGTATLSGQVLRGAQGPVTILFSLSDEEKRSPLFGDLKTRYEGELRGGDLLIKVPGGVQSLERFLAGYRLRLNLKEVSGGR